jgi:hypothetical protein
LKAWSSNIDVQALITYLQTPLGQLRDLRIVHLYQDRLNPALRDLARSRQEIVNGIQDLAALIFQRMHTTAPRLNVLIWGMHGEVTELDKVILHDLGAESYEDIPQVFLVKRSGQYENGTSYIYAAVTTRTRLRDEFPDLDLLAHDPRYQELDRHAAQM